MPEPWVKAAKLALSWIGPPGWKLPIWQTAFTPGMPLATMRAGASIAGAAAAAVAPTQVTAASKIHFMGGPPGTGLETVSPEYSGSGEYAANPPSRSHVGERGAPRRVVFLS